MVPKVIMKYEIFILRLYLYNFTQFILYFLKKFSIIACYSFHWPSFKLKHRSNDLD